MASQQARDYRICKTSPYTITVEELLVVQMTVLGTVTINLPASMPKNPERVREVVIIDGSGDAANHNYTVTAAGTDTINGNATLTMSTAYGRQSFFDLGNGVWQS
jgi:hypothetical protein